jgi:hypothetical protein
MAQRDFRMFSKLQTSLTGSRFEFDRYSEQYDGNATGKLLAAMFPDTADMKV